MPLGISFGWCYYPLDHCLDDCLKYPWDVYGYLMDSCSISSVNLYDNLDLVKIDTCYR